MAGVVDVVGAADVEAAVGVEAVGDSNLNKVASWSISSGLAPTMNVATTDHGHSSRSSAREKGTPVKESPISGSAVSCWKKSDYASEVPLALSSPEDSAPPASPADCSSASESGL